MKPLSVLAGRTVVVLEYKKNVRLQHKRGPFGENLQNFKVCDFFFFLKFDEGGRIQISL